MEQFGMEHFGVPHTVKELRAMAKERRHQLRDGLFTFMERDGAADSLEKIREGLESLHWLARGVATDMAMTDNDIGALLLQQQSARGARARRTYEKAIRAFRHHGNWLRKLDREVMLSMADFVLAELAMQPKAT